MEISCSICRYGESHDYLNRWYCRNKNCYQSGCFDQPETFNCPHGRLRRELRQTVKPTDNKLPYSKLRNEIHNILSDFFNHELSVHKAGEFDFEYMEFRTDEILRLIKRQGGTYGLEK